MSIWIEAAPTGALKTFFDAWANTLGFVGLIGITTVLITLCTPLNQRRQLREQLKLLVKRGRRRQRL